MSAGPLGASAAVSRDLGLLAPQFRDRVQAALAECNDPARPGGPLRAWVFEAYRSPELQAEYYQRGRTLIPPDQPVTNAPTNEYSWHGYGLAVDVIHADQLWRPERGAAWFAEVACVFKRHDCGWGGDWKQADLPHFQWGRCRPSPSDLARLLLRTRGLQAVWERVGAA